MSLLEDRFAAASPSKRWMLTRVDILKNAPDGARRWLRDLGKNDFDHAEAVEEYLGQIIRESGVSLTLEDLYILICAVYTHDLGYRVGAKEHARLSHDEILAHPATYFIHDESLAQAVAAVVLAHGLGSLEEIPSKFPVDFLSKTKEFDLQFLGALLLLADEMDQGYLRVFNRPTQQTSVRNSVYHVEIGPQIIKLKTKPQTEEQWRLLRATTDAIESRLTMISAVLRSHGVRVEQVTLYPTVWAEKKPHRATPFPPRPEQSSDSVLFLLDRTVFAAEVVQRLQNLPGSVTVIPIFGKGPSDCSPPKDSTFTVAVCTLGEDFSTPLPESIVKFLISNTREGAGLVCFPFVAWSTSQGINDAFHEVLPVTLAGGWAEGTRQRISRLIEHPLTAGLDAFTIENTYEWLDLKPDAECIIRDSRDCPFLVLGRFGKGRVAYLNLCSHLCQELRFMVSPVQQEPKVIELVTRVINWAKGQ